MSYKSDIEIAREAETTDPADRREAWYRLRDLVPFGHDKAKISAEFIKAQQGKKDGKLILVAAINPTPAGEGKTTTTVGLGDGLNAGKNAMICPRSSRALLRHEGQGCAGATRGLCPWGMNLHFTGDFRHHLAHNLLSAMIKNHICWGNEQGIDTRQVVWRRVLDMNDRALRDVVTSLRRLQRFPAQAGFDITVASKSCDPVSGHRSG